jgi:hypothetical protein
MSGTGMPFGDPWIERLLEDVATFGEGIPRCQRSGCNAVLKLYFRETLVLEQCEHFRHTAHAQSTYPTGWHGEP